jgi:hypothetical protein
MRGGARLPQPMRCSEKDLRLRERTLPAVGRQHYAGMGETGLHLGLDGCRWLLIHGVISRSLRAL